MQRLEVSGAVRPIYVSLGVKRLITEINITPYFSHTSSNVFRNELTRHYDVYTNTINDTDMVYTKQAAVVYRSKLLFGW